MGNFFPASFVPEHGLKYARRVKTAFRAEESPMERLGDEVHLEDDEARGGQTPHIVRYVLGISLTLAILALSAVWIWRALEEQPNSSPVTAIQHALGN